MKPKDFNALYSKGQALDSLGQHPDAIKYYDAYINALNSTGFDIYRNSSSGIEMVYPANWTENEYPASTTKEGYLNPPGVNFSPGSGSDPHTNATLDLEVYSNAREYFKVNSFREILNSFLSGDASTKADYSRKVTIYNWHGLSVSLENVIYTEPQPIGRIQFLALKTMYQDKFYNFLFHVDPKNLNKYIEILRHMSSSFRILNSDGQLVTPFANIIGLQR
jgi:tetratricopeptide (TPR) repeat protein